MESDDITKFPAVEGMHKSIADNEDRIDKIEKNLAKVSRRLALLAEALEPVLESLSRQNDDIIRHDDIFENFEHSDDFVVDRLEDSYFRLRLADDAGIDWDKIAFGSTLSGNVATIYAGNLRQHGILNVAVSETNVTLTGDPEYVYVNHTRGSSTASILHSSSEPVSNSTTLKVPLVKCSVVSGTTYQIDMRMHFGDINLDTPIQ